MNRPTSKPGKLFATALAIMLYAWLVPQQTFGADWVKVNAGGPLYYEGEVVGTVKNGRGDLLYFINDTKNQTLCGKIESGSRRWSLFANGAFQSQACLPGSISNTVAKFDQINLFPSPDNPDGLIGVGRWPAYGLVSGTNKLDIHGNFGGLIFDGAKWKKWKQGTEYSTGYMSALIWYSHQSVHGGMDYNPADGTGILIGTQQSSGSGYSSIVFLRYNHFDASSKWRIWKNGDWGSSTSLPSPLSLAYPVYPQLNTSKEQLSDPSVAHLGSGNYLFIVRFRNTAGEYFITAIRYAEAGKVWQMWDGSSWQGPDAAFGAIASSTSMLTYKKLVKVADGVASYIYRHGNSIIEIPYDAANGHFGAPVTIGTDVADNFAAIVDEQNSILLFSADLSGKIYLRKKPFGGVWSGSEQIYAASGAKVSAADLIDGNPVCFVNDADGIFALGENSWNEVAFSMPEPVSLPSHPGRMIFKNHVESRAPNTFYGSGGDGQIALDQDGYIYAPSTGYCHTTIRHRDDLDWTLAKSWGHFWDHFSIPGGAAVDNTRGKVYVTNGLIATGTGSVIKVGNVKVFDMAVRTENMGWQGYSGDYPPADWSRSYISQKIDSFAWPADAAVNEALGRLYVLEALDNKITVYDIENTIDKEGPANSIGIASLKDKVSSADQPRVDALLAELVAHGDLGWGNAEHTSVYWIGHDFDGTYAYIEALVPYSEMSSGSQSTFIRNLMASYKARRDLPVLLHTIGGVEGGGNGQFSFPQGITVDPDGNLYVADTLNHRIQKFDFNGVFVKTWGGYGLQNSAMLYPYGIEADPTLNLIYVSDPTSEKFMVFDREGDYLYGFNIRATGIAADGNGAIYLANLYRTASSTSKVISKYEITNSDVDSNGDGIPDSLQVDINTDFAAHDIHCTTDEDTVLNIELQVSGDTAGLEYAILEQPVNGTVTLSGKSVTYTPHQDYCGSDSFRYYAVKNGNEHTNLAQVFVTVNPINDPPVVHDMQVDCIKDVYVKIGITVHDPDPEDSHKFYVITPPQHGTLMGEYPNINYFPAQGFVGTDSIVFRVEDSAEASDTATVTITVLEKPKMLPPSIKPNGAVFNQGAPIVVTIAPHREMENLTWIFYTVDGSEPTMQSIPYLFPITIDTDKVLKARAFQKMGGTDYMPSDVVTATFKMNKAPVVNAGADIVIPNGYSTTLSGTATDDGLPNGNLQYEWSVVSAPGRVRIDDTGALDTAVTFGEPGVYVLRLTVSDGMASASDEISIRVYGYTPPAQNEKVIARPTGTGATPQTQTRDTAPVDGTATTNEKPRGG